VAGIDWRDAAKRAARLVGLPEGSEADRHQDEARPDDSARRAHLASLDTATVSLTVTGTEDGSIDTELPYERVVRTPDPATPGEHPPLSWLVVRVESPDPLPMGSTTLAELSVAVPDYRGPGRYDLVELGRRAERGEIEWGEVLDLHLNPIVDPVDRVFHLDLYSGAAAVIEAADDGVRFDLPMTSAHGSIRVAGAITWA
jgi:hypothetical protein